MSALRHADSVLRRINSVLSAKLHSKVCLYGTLWSKLSNSVFSNCKFYSKCVSSAKICVNRVGRRANSALSSANYILLALPTLL
jgi:hypothetical protein